MLWVFEHFRSILRRRRIVRLKQSLFSKIDRIKRLIPPPHIRLRIGFLGAKAFRQADGLARFGIGHEANVYAGLLFKLFDNRRGVRLIDARVKHDLRLLIAAAKKKKKKSEPQMNTDEHR